MADINLATTAPHCAGLNTGGNQSQTKVTNIGPDHFHQPTRGKKKRGNVTDRVR